MCGFSEVIGLVRGVAGVRALFLSPPLYLAERRRPLFLLPSPVLKLALCNDSKPWSTGFTERCLKREVVSCPLPLIQMVETSNITD